MITNSTGSQGSTMLPAISIATVSTPSSISTVTNYPRGYVRCFVDVTLLGDAASRQRMQTAAVRLMSSFAREFPGVSVREPAIVGRQKLDSGKEFLRLKFRVWPNRGGPIETTFRQELEAELKRENAEYQSWMISIAYEIEARTAARLGFSWLLRRADDASEDGAARRRASR